MAAEYRDPVSLSSLSCDLNQVIYVDHCVIDGIPYSYAIYDVVVNMDQLVQVTGE